MELIKASMFESESKNALSTVTTMVLADLRTVSDTTHHTLFVWPSTRQAVCPGEAADMKIIILLYVLISYSIC